MEFRALTQADVDFMAKHTKDRDCYKESSGQSEYSYALVDSDEQTLVVGGFRLMNKTTCVCWFDVSDVGFENIIKVVRTIKEWTEGYTDKTGKKHIGFYEMMGIVRAEAYVLDGHEEGERFVKHFNFCYDRNVIKYYGHCSANLYVKFFDWENK